MNALPGADFSPVPLKPESFTHDVVVEKSAPPPLSPATTASMDTGTNNTGLGWYERGYNLDWPATGLPAAGATFTSEFTMDHEYRLAADYRTNNALLLDAAQPDGSLTLVTPAVYDSLSLLVSGGNGGRSLNYAIHYGDGSVQNGTVTCPDWLHTLYATLTSYGCVNVGTFTFYGLNANYPGLHGRDVTLENKNSAVTRIDFHFPGGTAHDAVFALSGSIATGGPFSPVAVQGYNADMIVEATAGQRVPLRSATTASVECGSGNGGYAWYEAGYYCLAPETGLPPAGATLTAQSPAGHNYQLASSYTNKNGVVLSLGDSPAIIIPAKISAFGALSFLGAAAGGEVTVGCEVFHADGSWETNWFLLPDWLSSGPRAFSVNGRVNLDFRSVDWTTTSGLFAADIALTNASSPVTSVNLVLAAGAETAHALVLAMSGSSGAPTPPRPWLKIDAAPGGGLKLSTSGPGRLESTRELIGAATVWRDEGAIGADRVLIPTAGEPSRYYRVVAQ